MKICCEDHEFILEFIKTHEKKRLKLMKTAHKYTDELFAQLREYATKDIMDDLAERIKTENIKDLIVEQLAIKAGMTNYYDSIYRLASDHVHTSPRTLEQYLRVNEKGEIVELRHAPNDDGLESNLLTLANLMLIALISMLKLHTINEEATIKTFHERLISLSKKVL